ncbi:hypothetical protein TNCV_1104831 [Trichonephila clavipes]|nr:hypothetical protein TNCV_1104831 [Trichonephila clavipes]
MNLVGRKIIQGGPYATPACGLATPALGLLATGLVTLDHGLASKLASHLSELPHHTNGKTFSLDRFNVYRSPLHGTRARTHDTPPVTNS